MRSPAHAHEQYSLNIYVLTDTLLSLCSFIQWSTSDFKSNNAHLIPNNAITIIPSTNCIFAEYQPSTTWKVVPNCLVRAEVGEHIRAKQTSHNNC
ncbi:MAG: hypothetical protein EBU08_13895 [Micrococcales bacterium]|nr:hypothetical protein [Micrococcales bacterium]